MSVFALRSEAPNKLPNIPAPASPKPASCGSIGGGAGPARRSRSRARFRARSLTSTGDPSEAYSSAKAGVLGLTRKLAKRLGPEGVRINCICPGIIETPRWRSPGMEEPQFARRYRQMAPLGRFGKPEEVAKLVLFFACDDSSFITGQDIAIDGGFTSAARFESVDFGAD